MDAKEIRDARFQIAYWRDYAKYCDGKVAHAVRVLFPVGARVRYESASGKVKGVVVGYFSDKPENLMVKVKTEFETTVHCLTDELKLEGEE